MLYDDTIPTTKAQSYPNKFMASLLRHDQDEVFGITQARRVTDLTTGKSVAYIGFINGQMVVHLPRPMSIDDFGLLSEYIKKVR